MIRVILYALRQGRRVRPAGLHLICLYPGTLIGAAPCGEDTLDYCTKPYTALCSPYFSRRRCPALPLVTGERASARSYERRRGRSYETSGVDLRRPVTDRSAASSGAGRLEVERAAVEAGGGACVRASRGVAIIVYRVL